MSVLDRTAPRAVIGSALVAVPLAMIAGLTAAFAQPSTKQFVTSMLVNVVIVIGLQSFIGNSGIVSFGHITFMGVGAYATAIVTIPVALKADWLTWLPESVLQTEVDPIPALAIATIAAGVLALPTGAVLMRLSGGAGAIASFAMFIAFHAIIVNLPGVVGGTQTILGLPRGTTLFGALVLACVAVLAARLFRESSVGIRLRASAMDPVAARAMGVSPFRLRVIAWVISAMIVGLGGALFALQLTAFGPGAFYLAQAFLTLAMLIIGGVGTVSGAAAGAVVVSIASELLRRAEQTEAIATLPLAGQIRLTQVLLGIAIILVMAFRPEGLFGRTEAEQLVARLFKRRRRSAEMRQIEVEA